MKHARPRDASSQGLGTLAVFAGLLVLALGCGSPATSPSARPSDATSLPPTASTALASVGPASQAASAAAASSGTGLDAWSKGELFLLAGLEKDLRPVCGKTSKLPESALDGIECKPHGVASMGIYRFGTRTEARELYFARLAEYKVKPETGDVCHDGQPGEGIDTPGFPGYELRVGCYVDETGAANVRMLFPAETRGQNVYIGVVGNNSSIKDLFGWLFPDFQPGLAGCSWCISKIWALDGP